MSSLIAKHRQIQAQIKSLQAELLEIESSPRFQNEKEFLEKLEQLMQQYEKTADDVIKYLDPEAKKTEPKKVRGPRPGTPRKRFIYKNPHTGEEVTAAGQNHKVLKGWKLQHPGIDIKSWIVGEAE